MEVVMYWACAVVLIVGAYLAGRYFSVDHTKDDCIDELQKAKSDLEMRIAVEEQKASRIPSLERQLSEKETDVISIREGKASLEATLAEKNDRFSALQNEQNQNVKELQKLREAAANAMAQNATLTETLEQEKKQAEAKIALLLEAKESMTNEFKVLAENTMKTHGETFSKQNKEQIDTLLTPLREKITEFNQTVQTSANESNKERAVLAEQIRALSEASARMTSETTNLTKALKGDTQTQGAWGEMILSSILEKSGLREGLEYTSQESHTNDDGGRVRTDVIVNIPGGQKIIIDSKVSLVSFEQYVNAPEEEKSTHLANHLASARNHIKILSGKEYQLAASSHLDYVVMFVPIEGALAAALQADPSLTTFAVENNVAIATPTTLMMALRTVANVWQVERRNQNAEQIALKAGRIYDKLAGFLDDMKDLGRRIDQASGSFSNAMGKLTTGKGNLISQVDQLKELGAKTSKSLPLSSNDAPEALTAPEDEQIADLPALSSAEG
jgi:DNA recombination protein RmuC